MQAKLVLTTAVPLSQLFVSQAEMASATGSAAHGDAVDDDALRALMDDLGLTVAALKQTNLFSGEEESFAFARALSRLAEMGGREWVERGMDLEKDGGEKERDAWRRVRSRWREDSM